jgi:hypothetical protein
MYPHRIRLRGPWECEPLRRLCFHPDGGVEAVDGPVPAACRMTMPCCWSEGGLPDFTGRVRLRRRFGAPRRVDPHEHLWLTFAGADRLAEVWLNGQFLGRHEGADEPFEFEVTSRLEERNELTVELEGSAESGGLHGDVALEIRAGVFLRGVKVGLETRQGKISLEASGQVVGTATGPLELYLFVDGAMVASAAVEAAESGRPFRLIAEELSGGRERLGQAAARLELIEGGVLWFTAERRVQS